jgi:hypothetical protein
MVDASRYVDSAWPTQKLPLAAAALLLREHDSGRTLVCAECGYTKGCPNTKS